MIKGDTQIIARIIAVKHGVPLKEAETFVTALFDIITEGLAADKLVKVKGLGTFKLIDVKDRESVDVNTGERIVIEGRSKITFTPDSVIKELVNKPFAQFDTVALNDGVDFTDMNETENDSVTAAEDEAEYAGDAFDAEDDDAVQEEETAAPLANRREEIVEETVKDAPAQDNANTPDAPVAEKEDKQDMPAGIAREETKQEEPQPEAETVRREPEETFDDILQEVAIEQPAVNAVAPAVAENAAGDDTDGDSIADKDADRDAEDAVRDSEDTVRDSDNNGGEVVYDEEDGGQRRSLLWLWMTLLVIAVGAGMFCLGYYYGTNYAKPDIKAEADTAVVKPLTSKAAPEKDTADVVKPKTDSLETAKKDSVKTETVQNNSKIMERARRIYKTGAYTIIGTKETVTVKAGQTLSDISGRKLGPDMECYIQVHNDIEDVREGMKIKIPDLKLKKKTVKEE